MPKLPQITGAELIRVLQKAGFERVRQHGSHVQLRRVNSDGKVTTFPVPVHGGRALKPGLLQGILRQAGMTVEELIRRL